MKQKPIILKPGKSLLHLPSHLKEVHPLHQKLQLLVCHLSGKSSAQHITMSSWRSGTIKQYKSYFERWEQFCIVNNFSVFEPDIGKVIELLTELFHTGIGYSAINTAQSALSSIILLPGGRPVAEHPLFVIF